MTADRSDEGFTLIEAVVSIALISVVMAALTMESVRATSAISQQGGRQAAIRLAIEGMEKVQGIRGAAVAQELDAMRDTAPVTVDRLSFTRSYTAQNCWLPAAGGACGPTQTVGAVRMLSVTVTVRWTARGCPVAGCSSDLTTLLGDASDEPMFNSDATPSTPALPPLKVGTPSCKLFLFITVSGCVKGLSLQILASGGSSQYSYSYKELGLAFLSPAVDAITGKVTLSLFSLLFPFPKWGVVSVRDKVTGKVVASRTFIWFPW